jgi:hypothetical protein
MTTDPDFFKKLYLYKTAFSPLHDRYVGIKKVQRDAFGGYWITAHVTGYPEYETYLFRPFELTMYCL